MATKKTNPKKTNILKENIDNPFSDSAEKKTQLKKADDKPVEKNIRTKKVTLLAEEKVQAVSPEEKPLKKSAAKSRKKVEEQPQTEPKIKKVPTSRKAKVDTSVTEPQEEIASIKIEEPANSKPLKITFQLRFTSQYGQTLYITGNHDSLGTNEVITALPMQYYNHEFWYATVNIPDTNQVTDTIIYRYFLKDSDGNISMECGDDKQVNPSFINAEELLIIDSWNYPGYYENTFYTEPFKRVLLKDDSSAAPIKETSLFTHTFKIKAPLLPKKHTVCLIGSIPELGEWNPENGLLMSRGQNEDWYSVNVDLSNADFPIAYKYGVYSTENNAFERFEEGDNRITFDVTNTNKLTVLADGFIKLPNNTFKGAGVAVPVFSLRTDNGLGIGEFSDIKVLVDWAKQVGLKIIQVLPVNDTTATHTNADSYPYAAISAFALHPVYINLPAVVTDENKQLLSSLEIRKQTLNAAETVKYEEVMNTKLEFIRKIFPLQKQATFSAEDFILFFTSNTHWLVPYAAFCYLRDEYGTADFKQWPTYNSFDVFEINNLATPVLTIKDEISIHYFIQYHLHLQLKSATEYAHANGVILKGDIPIGIFRNSCDAWQQPQLYNMDMQAGAPPDDFAVRGQNWGFPTYNWQRMAEDGFTWWKNRFAQMSYYFDAFRIDHILGFFRIWSIPVHAVEGVMGYFVPSIPVHINEFHERGIWFDHYRYTKPYITEPVLVEVFGTNAEQIKTEFLSKELNDQYQLLPAFDTQRKVKDYFASLDENEININKRDGLYNLISNVILFEVEGSQGMQYHFRIAIENTYSFHFLHEGTKHQLKELYINYFYRRQDDFWMKEALQKLPELKRSTNMLICGEDLGMVPSCVPGVMKDLGILSLEIQRMPKDPAKEFFHPNDAPYLSVVTPSTHDMSTIRGWWEEDRAKTQRFYNTQLSKLGNAPQICEPWINKAIILQHLYSPAMWSVFQIQDILGISEDIRRQNPADERINVPADPKHYWQYRMHITLKQLVNDVEFNAELKQYINSSNRG